MSLVGLQAGDKIERARDLFEQALESCPAKFAKPLYLMYGQLEEEFGLAKRAMNVYDRATRAVEAVDRLEVLFVSSLSSRFNLLMQVYDIRCLRITLLKLPPTLDYQLLDQSMNEPLNRYLIDKLLKCA